MCTDTFQVRPSTHLQINHAERVELNEVIDLLKSSERRVHGATSLAMVRATLYSIPSEPVPLAKLLLHACRHHSQSERYMY